METFPIGIRLPGMVRLVENSQFRRSAGFACNSLIILAAFSHFFFNVLIRVTRMIRISARKIC